MQAAEEEEGLLVSMDADLLAAEQCSDTDSENAEDVALDDALAQLQELEKSSKAEPAAQPLPAENFPAESRPAGVAPELSAEEKRRIVMERLAAKEARISTLPEDAPASKELASSSKSRKKSGTEIVVKVGEYGELHFYPLHNNVTAICRCPGHGADCKKTRTMNAPKPKAAGSSGSSKGGVREGQGRPIGLLVRWLQLQDQHASRQSHCENSIMLTISLEERQSAREFFRALPDAHKILSKERAKRDDEPHDEPDFIY